jgi:hypothetical protein
LALRRMMWQGWINLEKNSIILLFTKYYYDDEV